MSVYTTVPEDLLKLFLARYDAGELVSYTGISAGIENTNYFVETSAGRYVLTLFETLSAYDIPWYLELMHHLADHGVPSASPVADEDGCFLNPLVSKPAALVHRLQGGHVPEPNPTQCAAIGAVMARMHVAGQSFEPPRDNSRDLDWCHSVQRQLAPHLSAADLDLLNDELVFQKTALREQLPNGVIHADLFYDNALFDGDNIAGVIDFYYACNDALLLDLAITANDWCGREDGQLSTEHVNAMTAAYAAEREFTIDERLSWPAMLRAAALRFWLSRLMDLHFPREGEMTHIKDPDVYKRILIQHREQPLKL